jgi:uncharacterized protein
MNTASTARLASLMAYDCWALLENAEIARVAWQSESGVAMVPVNYRVEDGAVWFRIDPASTLAREVGGARVVLEVDQVEPQSRTGWSVIVVGTAELVDYLDAPDVLVDMQVWAPGPHPLFVRVNASEVTGRRLFAHQDDRG